MQLSPNSYGIMFANTFKLFYPILTFRFNDNPISNELHRENQLSWNIELSSHVQTSFPCNHTNPTFKVIQDFHVQGFRGVPLHPSLNLMKSTVGRFERTLCDLFHDRGYDTIA